MFARSINLTVTTLLMAALAGCNRPSPSIGFDRGGYRADSIAACSDGMRLGGAAREVADRICTCGVDRFLTGKSDVQLQAITEGEQQQDTRAAVQTCLEQEEDLGPLPDDLVRPGRPANGQEVAPELPALPPAEPDPNAGAVDGDDGRTIDQARRGDETGEGQVPTGNEVNTSRWRQPPR